MRSLGVRIVVCAVTIAGCQAVFGIHGATLSDGGTGQPCNENDNNNPQHCGSGLVCVLSQCRKPCSGDLECASGERCLPSDSHACNPMCSGGCIPMTSASCNPQNPCGKMGNTFIGGMGGCSDNVGDCTCKSGNVCASDGQCRAPCNATNMGGMMCQGGQSCVSDPTACSNQNPNGGGGGGQCTGACYGSPPHDIAVDGGGGGASSTLFYDATLGNATSLVASTNGLFFTVPNGDAGVYGCGLDACTPQKLPINGISAPSRIAMDATTFAFVDAQSQDVGVCNNAMLMNCTFAKLNDSIAKPLAPAVRGNVVAWIDTSGIVWANNGQDKLASVPFSGDGDIAMDGTWVYWIADKHVFRCSKPVVGCAPQEIPNTSAKTSITMSKSRVFWTEDSGIYFAMLGSNMRGSLVNANNPQYVVYDGYTGSVFWTEGDGSVKRANADSSPSNEQTVVSGGPNQPGPIAVSNMYVYWIAGGKIYRAPKG